MSNKYTMVNINDTIRVSFETVTHKSHSPDYLRTNPNGAIRIHFEFNSDDTNTWSHIRSGEFVRLVLMPSEIPDVVKFLKRLHKMQVMK